MNRIFKRAALVLAFLLLLGSVQFAPLEAAAESAVETVEIKLSMPPVNCGEAKGIKVTSSSKNCYLSSHTWKDIYGEPITDCFSGDNATLEVIMTTASGYVFSDAVQVTVDGVAVGFENRGTELVISQTYAPVIWAPSVAKHPADEEVTLGKIISFVSYCSFANESKWLMVDPDGKVFDAEDLPTKVKGVKVDVSYDKLNISPAKQELNGYKVKCEFKGPGGEITSRTAKINIVDKIEEKPEEEEIEEHEHVFTEEIFVDAGYHWQECECGAKKNRVEHQYLWAQFRAADLEQSGAVGGQCTICGYVMQISTELSTGERNRLLEEAETAAAAPETSALPGESPIPAAAAEAGAETVAASDVELDSKSKYLEPGGVVVPTETPGREADYKPKLDIAPLATPEPTASPSPTPEASPEPSPTAEPEQEASQSKGGFFSWLLNLFR